MNSDQAYLILNLKPNSPYSEVKHTYRKMALKTHPDRNDSELDGKKFKLITEAYHTIKNNNKSNNSKKDNYKKYNDTKTKQESNKSWNTQDKTPEENWSRYTKQTEQSDPQFWQEYVSEFWRGYESAKTNQTKNPYDFEIKQEVKPSLVSNVDKSLCIGCCSCEIIAPQVFHIDKNSKTNPKSSVINQNGASLEKIIDAAQTCPTKAIKVEERLTGKRLYPY